MIRKFRKPDLDAVMQIWLASNMEAHDFIPSAYWMDHYDMVRTMLPEAEIYVHENKETKTIDGFIGIHEDYIEGIFVKKSMRSKGIGKQLLDYAKNAKTRFVLNVYQKNNRAIRFYEREHFRIQSEGVDHDTSEKDLLMIWKK